MIYKKKVNWCKLSYFKAMEAHCILISLLFLHCKLIDLINIDFLNFSPTHQHRKLSARHRFDFSFPCRGTSQDFGTPVATRSLESQERVVVGEKNSCSQERVGARVALSSCWCLRFLYIFHRGPSVGVQCLKWHESTDIESDRSQDMFQHAYQANQFGTNGKYRNSRFSATKR